MFFRADVNDLKKLKAGIGDRLAELRGEQGVPLAGPIKVPIVISRFQFGRVDSRMHHQLDRLRVGVRQFVGE